PATVAIKGIEDGAIRAAHLPRAEAGTAAVVIPVGPHDQIGVTIPVHIPGTAHGNPEPVVRIVAVKSVENAAIHAAEHPRTAGGTAVVVIEGDSHHHIVITIPVHIPRAAHRTAKIILGTIAVKGVENAAIH